MNLSANSTLYYVCWWWCCCCLHVRSTALPKLCFATLQNDIPIVSLCQCSNTKPLKLQSQCMTLQKILSHSLHEMWLLLPCNNGDNLASNIKWEAFNIHGCFASRLWNRQIEQYIENKHTGTKMHWLDSTWVCSSAGNYQTYVSEKRFK